MIIVDGGKGQLSAALESIDALGLRGKVSIVGIAKRLEEIYFPGDSLPLYIDKNSESLRVIQHMRDEAHRFGITFHRNKRSKGQVKSALDSIPGIGQYLVSAINSRDYPVVRGSIIYIAFTFSIIMLIVDLFYAFADPRIKAQYVKTKKKKTINEEGSDTKEAAKS